MTHRFSVKVSELQRTPVTDSDGVRVGKVEDVWLEHDGSIWLVVGGNIVEEILAKFHIRPDIDLFVLHDDDPVRDWQPARPIPGHHS